MRKILQTTLLLALLTGCGSSQESDPDGYEQSPDEGYEDGTYCAEVDYYNPNTGTSSTYTLEVEVEGNEITTIHWPNGGWLDDSHFSSTDISDGDASFTSDSGYDYTVRITGKGGGCYTDTYIDEEEEEYEETVESTEEDSYLYEEESLPEEEY